MDAKEIKSALKSVKECIDQKDYKAAIKQCKSILKSDRNNYLALVFYGAAVQETEQKDEAPKAFKKAIEVSPEHLLAWRGLASFYEKNEKNCDSKDLLQVYARLIVLETDTTKLLEIIDKFEKLTTACGECVDIKPIFDSLGNFDEQKKHVVQQCLLSVLSSITNLEENIAIEYLKFLKNLLSQKPLPENHLNLIKKYLKLLYKQKLLEEIISEGKAALELYSEDVSILEWICKAYTELPNEYLVEEFKNLSSREIFLKLIEISPESYLGHFCKSLYELNSKDYLNACESLKEALKSKPLASLWVKLLECQASLYQFLEVEQSCLEALKTVEESTSDFFICKKKLLQSYAEQEVEEKWREGENLGKKLVEAYSDDTELVIYLIKVLIKLGKVSEVEKYLKDLDANAKYKTEVTFLKCLLLKYENKMEECKKSLEKLVEEKPDCSEAWLELGKIHYSENNSVPCLSSLLKATKLNQWCFSNFLYIGHCYRFMVKDLEKARRCYQKAFQLNPTNVETGIHLSDIYRILGKEELNVELLKTVTAGNPRLKWAWLKLGLHYLSVNQQQNAVNSLRVAVRLDQNDKDAWEYLGDAYFAQGAYTSALKSYQRVSELNSDSVYPMLQIANIKHLLELFTESIQEFRIINENFPNYIPGLKGHSEACLSHMKYYLSQNLNGLAQDCCQEAVTCLIKCLQIQKDLICIWKLLGDACTLLSELPEKYCSLKVASWMVSNTKGENEIDTSILDKAQVLKLGSRSFCQALTINSDISDLWHDLAFVYNRIANNSKTEDSRKQFRILASAAVKKGILLNDSSWKNWNLYGIILASKEIQNYRLAQHCFIKAITKLDTNAVTWTNLGTLYLVLNDLQLANQSFTEAQKYDHDYVYCWVGQAIIAQMTAHHDAMDLFRHSTQLGFSTEGCLGYSNLVCQTLLNTKNKNDKNYLYSIKNMNAVTVASDALTWYTDRFTNNPWAFNMLGLLLERQMIYKKSAEAYKSALDIIRYEKPNEEKDNSDIIDMVLLNYARVLSNLKKYDEAIAHLKQIKKATFTNQCEMAATYYKAKFYEEAYSSYETTLEWLATDVELKSHILVAMTAVVYLHQGQEDAKLLLMQACQLKPPSVQGLFALCALGMLHSDLPLSELALKELYNYKSDIRYLGHIAVFESYIYLFKGQKEKAVRALCKVVHQYPNQPSLWLSLCLLVLHLYPSFDSKSAAHCAQVASTAGRSSIDISKVMSLISLSNLLSGEGLKSLRSSQKAVHMFPDVTENWVVLVASVLSKCLVQQSVEEIFWLKKMITYIRRKFESSKPMTQWLSNNNRKITMMAEKLGCGFPEIEVEASYFNLDCYFEG